MQQQARISTEYWKIGGAVWEILAAKFPNGGAKFSNGTTNFPSGTDYCLSDGLARVILVIPQKQPAHPAHPTRKIFYFQCGMSGIGGIKTE